MLADSPTQAQWFAPPRDKEAERALMGALGIPSLLAASLVSRGIRDAEIAAKFLSPSLDDLHDPMLLPDAEAALREIMAAKEAGETVYVHGDYDVDGVTSTAIWTRSLQKLGFNVIPHVPHRMKEGYGIHKMAVQEAVGAGAKLFLTCDCGSGAFETVAMAREAGMRVVVTDHHELGSRLPDAQAVVNPHRKDSRYPFTDLCGAGVAFKVAQAVAEECGAKRDQFLRAYLDLVCLGTIADIVSLTGENRILAWHGLRNLATSKKMGIRALMSVSAVNPTVGVSSADVGYRLGPRINAAGRVDDAEHALQLLLTEDESVAKEKAELLNRHNEDRKIEERRILDHAIEIIEEGELGKKPLIFVAAPGWHKGVVGIVASRISKKYWRPALVGCVNEETDVIGGSARSIPGFNLHEALEANAGLFLSKGGHAMAAGFSFELDKLDEVTRAMTDYADKALTPEDLVPRAVADAETTASEYDFNAISSLEALQPCGAANPQPRFIIRGCPLAVIKPCANPDHVQFAIDGRQKTWGIGFSKGALFEGLEPGDEADLLVEPKMDAWEGQVRAKLQLEDMQVGASRRPL